MEFYDKLKCLPDDVIGIILHYLPYNKNLTLNTDSYKKNHIVVIPRCLKISFEKYIRTIIIKDYDFIFNILLNDNLLRWITMRNYRYEQMIFKNYFYFLKYFSIKNNSEKCLSLLKNINFIPSLNRKQHKNYINRNIIWIK